MASGGLLALRAPSHDCPATIKPRQSNIVVGPTNAVD